MARPGSGSGDIKYYMRSMKLQSRRMIDLLTGKRLGRLSADVAFDDGRFYYRHRVMRRWWWDCNCGRAIAEAVDK